MAEGYKDWALNDVLTSADLEDYTVKQSVMRFASSAARDTALTSAKTEGMVTYQLDGNDLDVYNGSSFSTLIAPAHGALTSWTPVVVQGATPTLTVNAATYSRVGRFIYARFVVTTTSAGTGGTAVTVSLPVNGAQSTSFSVLGSALLYDASVTTYYQGILVAAGAGSVNILSSAGNLGAAGFTAALANNDIISGFMCFEASADA